MDKKTLMNQYAEFMGSWMAGVTVGHFIVKIIYAAVAIWFSYKVFF